jgi:HK97 family phage major capsid protein/HK97 family phage prohead protease
VKVEKTLYRDFEIRAEAVDAEARTVALAFSSETPVERWFGTEVLDHAPGAVRLDRLNGGGALLVNHDPADQVGVIESARVDRKDRMGRAVVRFGKSARAQEIFEDVKDGIRRLVSVGYRIHELVLEKQSDKEGDVYRAADWEPFEISLVPVPADAAVGVGRSEFHLEDHTMTKRTDSAPTPAELTPTDPAPEPVRAPAPVVPISARADGVEAERARVREITAIGKRFNLGDDAERAIEAGTAADAFKDAVLAKLAASGTIRPAESPDIGMGARDVERYSFLRALLAASDPVNAHKLAPFELECSTAAQKRRGDSRDKTREHALTVPVDVLRARLPGATSEALARAARLLAQRDLTVGTATAGGHLVATDLLGASFIDLLRNAMVLDRMGMTMLTDLNGNVAIPRQTGAATTYWVAEGGAPTESQQAVDQVTLSPKTLGAYTDYSRRLLLQSSVDVEAFVRADLAAIVGLAIQAAVINGSGASNQPLGILNTSGIGSVAGGTNGGAPTYDHMVDLESAVANANAAAGQLAYLTNTKVRGKLRKTEEFATTNGRPVWTSASGVDGVVLGYPAVVTNSVPSDLTKGSGTALSAIVFGNWADLLLGMWGGLDLMVDPYALATSGGRRLIALQDLDVAVRHPESFAAMKDAITT